MREKYESLSASVLRELAKSRGIKGTSTMKKAQLVEAMLALDESEDSSARAVDHRVKAVLTYGAGDEALHLYGEARVA